MKIKWNEYTWYSKLSAILFFILVLPVLSFYVGTQYERTMNVLSALETENSVLNATQSAEEMQKRSYDKAKAASDAELKAEITKGLKVLLSGYNTALGLEMTKYIGEYNRRSLADQAIDTLINKMLDAYGPCWGIPEGQCRE